MHCCGSAGQGHNTFVFTDKSLKILFKLIHVGPEGNNVIVIKSPLYVFLLNTCLAHMRKTQINPFAISHFAPLLICKVSKKNTESACFERFFNSANETGQHSAGAALDEFLSSVANHIDNSLSPSHGIRQLLQQICLD